MVVGLEVKVGVGGDEGYRRWGIVGWEWGLGGWKNRGIVGWDGVYVGENRREREWKDV